VNHIDTAAFYFSPLRSANELINRALAPYSDDLVITTKVGPGRDPSGEWLPLARPAVVGPIRAMASYLCSSNRVRSGRSTAPDLRMRHPLIGMSARESRRR
jgi:aryl-alcohol dehydrogenase-like predicted oxidoreductase